MVKKVVEASQAIAEALKLCKPAVIAAYPITPQTHIVEHLSQMVADGDLKSEYIRVESEHSAMSACFGAACAGVRTFTATASQGLELMHEILHIVSGSRLPIVMAVANRAVSGPINIWNDWSDAMAARDCGWIQLYCETAQEALDTVIQAYKISENHEILLPTMVCIDGFYLSHTYEPVDVPDSLNGFLPDYDPVVSIDMKNPITQGSFGTPPHFQEFREQQYHAMNRAKRVIKQTNKEFAEKFGRSYGNGLIETYNIDKAKHIIISLGSICGTIKYLLEKDNIKDVGLVRIKSFRPFPEEELREILNEYESVGVLEKAVTLGIGGPVWSELRGLTSKPIADFIGGLGGRDITLDNIREVFDKIRSSDTGVHWLGSKLKGDYDD
ncbi:MAG: pyruvate ferredoxin oxidoreductase [Candidatus Aenigmarchaeota archaeon]|nr:pyruvate ferredoxin oxidoreductase [Candidatus Aenigmarchaeota archaeon]